MSLFCYHACYTSYCYALMLVYCYIINMLRSGVWRIVGVPVWCCVERGNRWIYLVLVQTVAS
ncbi:hypothetical protein BDZ91DRAFT_714421 [Kalaharituber pfeilii]|nr:hypothetical protein BDZ91DRAFT_714421 [Kalaharituber pfeilii]